jgi:chromosome segregation ATPase
LVVRLSSGHIAMTEYLRQELEALREAAHRKANDTKRLAERLEAVIAKIVGRPQGHLRDAGDPYEIAGSIGPGTSDVVRGQDRPDEEQREALEQLQREMRNHVAEAAELADRIAALQLRIDSAIAALTQRPTDKADS